MKHWRCIRCTRVATSFTAPQQTQPGICSVVRRIGYPSRTTRQSCLTFRRGLQEKWRQLLRYRYSPHRYKQSADRYKHVASTFRSFNLHRRTKWPPGRSSRAARSTFISGRCLQVEQNNKPGYYKLWYMPVKPDGNKFCSPGNSGFVALIAQTQIKHMYTYGTRTTAEGRYVMKPVGC